MSGLTRRRFLAVAACAAALPVGDGVRAATLRWRGRALGAEAAITLKGDPTRAGAALQAARAALAEAEALFSLYRPDSLLVRLNRDGRLTPPGRLRDLLALCDRLHGTSEGRFDPSVQPLWHALATGGDVDRAAALVDWKRVRLGPEIRLAPGQALTLNGIAQGAATDMVTEALAAHGFAETLVDIGEFRAGHGDWRLGVADPAHGLVEVLRLSGAAVATSSPDATTLGGRAHILGPRGQRPAWSTVSVVAGTAALADGLSTALALTPAAEVEATARRLPGVRRVILVDGAGAVRRLEF